METSQKSSIINQNQPLVSIGIPTFNRFYYLKEAIQSILSQDYENIEVIISDNCSNDETEAYCSDLALNNAKVTYIRQSTNIGAAKNFEYVLNQASGDFFMWLADDDRCESEFITELMSEFQKDESIVLCASGLKIINEENELIRIKKLDGLYLENDWNKVKNTFFEFLPSDNDICYTVYGIFKTNALKQYLNRWSFDCLGFTVGTEFVLLAYLATLGKIVAIPKILKVYRYHSGNGQLEIDKLNPLKNFILKCQLRNRLLMTAIESKKCKDQKFLLIQLIIYQYLKSIFVSAWLFMRNHVIKPLVLALLKLLRLKIRSKVENGSLVEK